MNDAPHMRRRGRTLTADVLVEIAPKSWLLRIRDGAIEAVTPDPKGMTGYTTALRFDPEAWGQFMTPVPPPGRHDLMALVKTGKLKVEGSLHPFMAHLLWFKEAFTKLREAAR
jgi:hypothetical protein